MTEPPPPPILLPLSSSYRWSPPPHQPRASSGPSDSFADAGSVDTGRHAARGDFDPEFIAQVKTQSWSLFSVCMVFIVLRIISRIKRLGIRNLHVDDYLMVLAGGFYTTLVVTLNLTCQNGGSNLYPPWTSQNFTDQQITDRIFGSKLVLVSEQSMLNVIYTIKACMLIMYRRLTLGLTAQKLVKYLGWYVIAGYTSTQIAFFSGCRPFYDYWAMPAPDIQCNTLLIYNIIQACFNISSDCFMLYVVIPLILQVNVPWRQKAVLLFVFSMGGFVIIAATLTKIFGFSNVWDPDYMLWYMRESSVAIFVSNAPVIWPLLRELFPCLRSLTPGGRQRGSPPRDASGGRRRRSGSAWATTSSLWRRKFGLSTMTTTTTTTNTNTNNSTLVTIGGSGAKNRAGIPGGGFSDGLLSFLRSTRRASIDDETAAAPDDVEMGPNGGIYCGGAPTAVGQQLQLQQQQQHQHALGSSSAGSSAECMIPPWMASPEPPGPGPADEQRPGSSPAAPTPPPMMAPGTGITTTEVVALKRTPSGEHDGGGSAADERNFIFSSVTHNTPSDSGGSGGSSSGGGGGGSAIIHVVSTVEVRAEERTRSSSIMTMERVGRTDVYDWERSGVSKHRAAAYGTSTTI